MLVDHIISRNLMTIWQKSTSTSLFRAGALMAIQSKIEEIVQVANENLELSQSIDSPAN